MTDDEINLAISESIEPRPEEGEWLNGTGRLSKTGAWYKHFDGSHWQPRSWYTDEHASAMLLERMSKQNAYVWIEWDINDWGVMWKKTTTEEGDDVSIEYSHADRKTAIRSAYFAMIQKGATNENLRNWTVDEPDSRN